MTVESVLPRLLESTAGMDAAKGQNVFGVRLTQKHAGLLAPGAKHGFAHGFENLSQYRMLSYSPHYFPHREIVESREKARPTTRNVSAIGPRAALFLRLAGHGH